MHYRVYVKWETLSKESLQAKGIVTVHVFNNGEAFGSVRSWNEKFEFAVDVGCNRRSYTGINGNLIPKLPDEVMERLSIMVDSYFKGLQGDDHVCCWYQEPMRKWEDEDDPKFGFNRLSKKKLPRTLPVDDDVDTPKHP